MFILVCFNPLWRDNLVTFIQQILKLLSPNGNCSVEALILLPLSCSSFHHQGSNLWRNLSDTYCLIATFPDWTVSSASTTRCAMKDLSGSKSSSRSMARRRSNGSCALRKTVRPVQASVSSTLLSDLAYPFRLFLHPHSWKFSLLVATPESWNPSGKSPPIIVLYSLFLGSAWTVIATSFAIRQWSPSTISASIVSPGSAPGVVVATLVYGADRSVLPVLSLACFLVPGVPGALDGHCSPEGHPHHHQRFQSDLETFHLSVHLQDGCTSAAEGPIRWHLAARVPHSKWRRLRPHSHWQTSHVTCCTKLELPRAKATNHCGGHDQSHGDANPTPLTSQQSSSTLMSLSLISQPAKSHNFPAWSSASVLASMLTCWQWSHLPLQPPDIWAQLVLAFVWVRLQLSFKNSKAHEINRPRATLLCRFLLQ